VKQKKTWCERWKKRGVLLLVAVGLHSLLRLTVPYFWMGEAPYDVSSNITGRCAISAYDTHKEFIQFDYFSPWLFLTLKSPYIHFRVHDLVTGKLLADSRQLIPTPSRYDFYDQDNHGLSRLGFQSRGARIPLGEEDLIWKGFAVCRERKGVPEIAQVSCNLLRLHRKDDQPQACHALKKRLDEANQPTLYGFLYSLGIVALNYLTLPNVEPLPALEGEFISR
jgi:hypothetical protein